MKLKVIRPKEAVVRQMLIDAGFDGYEVTKFLATNFLMRVYSKNGDMHIEFISSRRYEEKFIADLEEYFRRQFGRFTKIIFKQVDHREIMVRKHLRDHDTEQKFTLISRQRAKLLAAPIKFSNFVPEEIPCVVDNEVIVNRNVMPPVRRPAKYHKCTDELKGSESMNKQLQLIENERFGNFRWQIIDGEAWFVGKDVATALGYKDHKNALKLHVDDEDKKGWQITTHGSEATLINESGVYALIFGSKLPTAKEFKHWITHDVLPSIRKYGYYGVDKDALALEKRRAKVYYESYLPNRHEMTAAISLLIVRAQKQGCKKADGWFYGKQTKWANEIAQIEKGQRKNSGIKNLEVCTHCEFLVKDTILQGLKDDERSWESIVAEVELNLAEYKRAGRVEVYLADSHPVQDNLRLIK